MGRTTSTQRAASRRTQPTAPRGGSGRRGAQSARTRTTKATPRSRAASSRTRTTASRARRSLPAGPWVPVAIVTLVLVLGWVMYPAVRLQYQASRRVAGLEQQYNSLKQRNNTLRTQVAALKTPQGIEKAAREDLGYAKSGEHVYIVMPPSKSASAKAAVSQTQVSSGSSVLQKVLDAVFGVSGSSTSVAP